MPSIDDLLKPIEGGNPSGKYLRRTPVYDQIKEARRADDPGPRDEWVRVLKTANFVEVERLAVEALAKQTKDLQIAAWLTEAWVNLHGMDGLTGGLTLLRRLVEEFWDTVYPTAEDGDLESRAAPLNWLGSKILVGVKAVPITRNGLTFLKYEEARTVGYEQNAVTNELRQEREQAIQQGMLTGEDFDKAKDATPAEFYERLISRLQVPLQALDALDHCLRDKFGDPPPNLQPLRETFETIAHTAGMFYREKKPAVEETPAPSGFGGHFFGTAPEPEPEPAAAPEPEPVVVTGGGAAVQPAVIRRAKPTPVTGSREGVIAQTAQNAEFLRNNDPSSPVPYLLLRALRWGELRATGDAPDAALLEAPPTETRLRLKELVQEANWNAVLAETEAAMAEPCGRAWLDLQRYAIRACEELAYAHAAQAIRSGVTALIKDFPHLPDTALADDTAAANPETRAWLDTLVKPSQARPEIGHAILMDEDAPAESKKSSAYETALEAARGGRSQEAVGILTSGVEPERSGRARFLKKIQLAQICLAAGRDSVAYPILRSVAREIDSRQLEEWEAPEVLAQPLTLLFRCISKMEVDDAEKQAIYSRICCLDPAQAMEFDR